MASPHPEIGSVPGRLDGRIALVTGGLGGIGWAVRGMTETAAMELGPIGIRVNSVHPGSTDTQMTSAVQRAAGNPFAFFPLSRRGAADEVAALVAHLASSESAYTTGAEVVVDGGLYAGPLMPAPQVAPPRPVGAR